MDEWYARYKMDSAGSIEENGSVYYRIISTCTISNDHGDFVLCDVDRNMRVSIGTFCKDELGNVFCVKAIEMIHFNGLPPEWYWKTNALLLKGPQSGLGEYLTAL